MMSQLRLCGCEICEGQNFGTLFELVVVNYRNCHRDSVWHNPICFITYDIDQNYFVWNPFSSRLPESPIMTRVHWRIAIELYQPQMWGSLKSHASASHSDPDDMISDTIYRQWRKYTRTPTVLVHSKNIEQCNTTTSNDIVINFFSHKTDRRPF